MTNQQAYERMQIKARAFDEIQKALEEGNDPTVTLINVDIAVVSAEAELERIGE